MKVDFLAFTAYLTMTLNLSKAEANDSVQQYFNYGNLGRYTIKQKKDLFNFAKSHATLTLNLIKNWEMKTEEEKNDDITIFTQEFNKNVSIYLSNNSFLKKEIKGALLAEVFNNALTLMPYLKEKEEVYLESIIEAKARITTYNYKITGEIIVPFYSKRMHWGEHGAHTFPTKMSTFVEPSTINVGGLSETDKKKFFSSPQGINWLDTPEGKAWGNTKEGRKFIIELSKENLSSDLEKKTEVGEKTNSESLACQASAGDIISCNNGSLYKKITSPYNYRLSTTNANDSSIGKIKERDPIINSDTTSSSGGGTSK
jgi:hypothetical protein